MSRNYRSSIYILNNGYTDSYPYPNVSQVLHWFKKGAPPGIVGSV